MCFSCSNLSPSSPPSVFSRQNRAACWSLAQFCCGDYARYSVISPLIIHSSVILSVYPSAASSCGVCFTWMCILSGDLKRRVCHLLGKCWVQTWESWCWAMLGANTQRWLMSCQDQCESRNARAALGRFSIKLSALPLLTQRKLLEPVRPHSPAWLCVSAAPVQSLSSTITTDGGTGGAGNGALASKPSVAQPLLCCTARPWSWYHQVAVPDLRALCLW